MYSSKTIFSAARRPSHDELPVCNAAGFADVVAVFVGQELRHAQGPAAGNDRDFVHGVDFGEQPRQQRVPGFVVGGHFAFVVVQRFLAARAHQHAVAGVFEVFHFDARSADAGRHSVPLR